jgi:hypothetical protein
LIGVEGAEGAHHKIAIVDRRERIVVLCEAEGLAETERRSPVSVPEDVHRRSEQIGGRVIEPDPVPPFP